MAETPPPSSPHPTPPLPTPPSPPANLDSSQYWCHQCDKRVAIETLPDQPDLICFECKNGFVELISIHHHHHIAFDVGDEDNEPAFGNEFLQVLRLIAQAARDDDAPPLPPADRDGDGDVNDYLLVELDRWNENDNEDEDEDEDGDGDGDGDGDDIDDEDSDEGVEIHNQLDLDRDGSDHNHDENEEDDDNNDEDEDTRRRQRRDVIRLQLRDFATRALSRHNRTLDWADILMGLEDHSIGFRFQVPHSNDGYIGNPGDYVDAAGYEALLQTLAENDAGKRGSPPASKSTVHSLPTVEVNLEINSNETEVCAICKDKVFNNENEIVKRLPCGHMYHEDCIVPWLGSRNTCPICRYELPTDDPEYEEDRKKRSSAMDTSTATSSGGAL